MLDLDPIKARLAAATPGRWIWSRVEVWGRVAKIHDIHILPNLASLSSTQQDEADADLIAHAPADLAALVDEVERLRAENTLLIVEAENLRSAIFRACEDLSAVADACA